MPNFPVLDPATPATVTVTREARVPDFDPTLGIVVNRPALTSSPVNRLVTIGDSLTHGYQSNAIFNTRLSWPSIVAWELGWDDSFRIPTYDGFGGLPLNIEFLLRSLEDRYGDKIDWYEVPSALFYTRHLLAEIDDWWERGPGAIVPPTTSIMHNLAVFGWDLRDALSLDRTALRSRVAQPTHTGLVPMVEHSGDRAALRIYESAVNAAGIPLTAFGAAQELGNQGGIDPAGNAVPGDPGIETLIVALGANNALGAVTSLKVNWSDVGYNVLGTKDAFNVWQPNHFAAEFAQVVAEVKKVNARHVIFGNVPHVTVVPVMRGVGTEKVESTSRYFPYYTRPWISDKDFDPKDDPCLTAAQARAVDSAIDQYNDTIADAVRTARRAGLNWYVLDIAGMLDRLASRRYIDYPNSRPDWWHPYELPSVLSALDPVPDSYFFTSDQNGRRRGGLFSLDGVHPTTIAYGLMAQEFVRIMQQAGVPFYYGDGKTARTGTIDVDFNRLLRLDSLISAPPKSIATDLGAMGWINEAIDWGTRVLRF